MSAKKKVIVSLPKGIATYNGKFYTNLYLGAYDTVEEAVSIRAKALEFKASLKGVSAKVAALAARPAPVATPTTNKDKFRWKNGDIRITKKKAPKAAPTAKA